MRPYCKVLLKVKKKKGLFQSNLWIIIRLQHFSYSAVLKMKSEVASISSTSERMVGHSWRVYKLLLKIIFSMEKVNEIFTPRTQNSIVFCNVLCLCVYVWKDSDLLRTATRQSVSSSWRMLHKVNQYNHPKMNNLYLLHESFNSLIYSMKD